MVYTGVTYIWFPKRCPIIIVVKLYKLYKTMDDKSFDIAAIAVSSGVLIGYHAYLYLAVFLYMNDNIQLSTNMKNSIWWLKKHELKGDAPTVTLAIQTFRNTILVAIFVGNGVF